MNRQSVCAALVLTLVLLTGCVSKTPAEPARVDGTGEAVPTVEALEFAPREAYHLAEIEVQSVEDGAVLTVDGVCELSVKGFGCGKTITADGKTAVLERKFDGYPVSIGSKTAYYTFGNIG